MDYRDFYRRLFAPLEGAALLHGTRAVDLGGADTAILQWIAEQDAERG